MSHKATSLIELLDQIESTADEDEEAPLDAIMDAIGRRAFGPLLVLFGLIILAPLVGDINACGCRAGCWTAVSQVPNSRKQ
jgi:hypothetical protein